MTTLSEIIDKLGQWCLEIFKDMDKILPSQEHKQAFENIFMRTLKKGVDLLDTDKPKIGRPLIEFLTFWLQSIKKAD